MVKIKWIPFKSKKSYQPSVRFNHSFTKKFHISKYKPHFHSKKLHENKVCFDCGEKETSWASWNLGILVCFKCSGSHRNLGSHISKVLYALILSFSRNYENLISFFEYRSLTLDEWKEEALESLLSIGNKKAEGMYKIESEYKLHPEASQLVRNTFITAKYTGTKFVMPVENGNDKSQLSDMKAAGVLKVEVIEGKDLMVADITGKSDPYVILYPGKIDKKLKRTGKNDKNTKLSVKTNYKPQTLNPVW